MSRPGAHAALTAHLTPDLNAELPAVAVLGIDETRRGKPIWDQDLVAGRWRMAHDRRHAGIAEAAGTAELLAHIDGRTAQTVTE